MSQTAPEPFVLCREEAFLDELAFGREDLQAIADAIADVDEPIDGHVGAVHRVVELLRGFRGRVVRRQRRVIRLVAVRAPVALHLAGVGIEHRDALVQIAVGDVGLVRFLVDEDLCDAAEAHRVVAAADKACDLPFLVAGRRAPALRRAPFLPICSRNLPSLVNFRMCESGAPLPPIQTLPL